VCRSTQSVKAVVDDVKSSDNSTEEEQDYDQFIGKIEDSSGADRHSWVRLLESNSDP